MDEFTPTTDQVRETWVGVQDITFGEGPDAHGDGFDRWLNEERAKVWDSGAKAMMQSIGDTYGTLTFIAPENPYRKANQ